MILVDTSVWIDHFRSSDRHLVQLLEANLVSVHPWIVGELACGNLADRANVLSLLKTMPQLHVASEDEVLFFIERHLLAGKGIGYIDAHLLAAAALGSAQLWTRDKRLFAVAEGLGLAYQPFDPS
jgi:predicted nucleic acid-binding protein